MVVVPSEVFREFVAGVVDSVDEASNDTCLLHHRKVAVCRTLSQRRRTLQQLRESHRRVGIDKHLDDDSAAAGVLLVDVVQPVVDLAVESFVGDHVIVTVPTPLQQADLSASQSQ